MTLDAAPGIVAITFVTVATLMIGTWGLKFSRTTSDFFVASRTVRPRLNASAIGGEYLSAASFLGVAVYPWLLVLGWAYVRRAERNERDFADLMSEADQTVEP